MESQDILFLTLAVAVAIITVMFVWSFLYIVRMARTLSGLVEDFRQRLAAIDEILQTIKDKITSTHLELSSLVTVVKEGASWFLQRRQKRRTNTRSE